MARILDDPTDEARPDFSEQRFDARRNTVANGEGQDVAVARLNALWDSEHDEQVAAWNAQQDKDRQAAEAAAKPDDGAPDIPDFDKDAEPPDHVEAQPAAYAMNKLRKGEFIELYYFTVEGCRDTATQTSASTDGFGLTRGEHGVVLQPLLAQTPSKKAVPDSALSWQQMVVGATLFIAYMRTCKYPERHCMSMTQFYFALEHHDLRRQLYGEEILIEYNALVRRAWFEGVRNRNLFNIAIINKELLKSATQSVVLRHQVEGIDRLGRLTEQYSGAC